MKWVVLVIAGCATAPAPGPLREVESRPVEVDAQAALRVVVRSWVDAVEAGQFDVAHGLLSKSWRERYSPERLAEDFQAEPLSLTRVRMIKAKLNEPIVAEGEGTAASLVWSAGRALHLTLEAEGWRIAAIE